MDNKEQYKKWHDDPNNWKFGFIYFNKDDERWFPPKRIGLMGWTVNFAQPYAYVFLSLIFFIAFIVKTYFKK